MKIQASKSSRVEHLSAEFAPVVEFELAPMPGPVSPASVQIRFKELRDRLVDESLEETANPFVRENIQRAAHDAAALAWTTQYPLLIMPVLFQEKARSAGLRSEKQRQVSLKSERILELVSDEASVNPCGWPVDSDGLSTAV